MLNRYTHRWAIVVLAIASWTLFPTVQSCRALGQDDVTMQRIFDVWKARQDSARTVSFSFKQTRTYAPGSMPSIGGMPGGANSQPESPPAPTPPTDVSHEYDYSLSLDGDLMRYSYHGPQWHMNHNRFIARTYTSVFDGTDDKSFRSEDEKAADAEGGGLQRLGFVRLTKYNEDVVDYNIWPILFTYRAVHPQMSRLSGNEWAVTGERGIVQDRNCTVLRKSQQGLTQTCWVDVERDCSVVRYDMAPGGNLRLRLDTAYQQDPAHGWVPIQWNFTKFFPESLKVDESSVSKVTDYQLGTELDPKTFRFDFPPGTEVTDIKGNISYLALKDGGRRIVTQEERLRGALYKDFLVTDSGMAGLPTKKGWLNRVWWAPVILLMAAIAIFLLWTKRFGARRLS